MHKSKEGVILSNIHRKINHVICIMYPNSMPDIIILAQAVIQILFYMIALLYEMPK